MNANILMQYKDGLSINKIAKINNTTNHLVRKLLTDNNIEIRDNSYNSRKYTLNSNIFEKIDTEEKAYWLGFLYADGCVHKNSNYTILSLSIVDIEHLEKFRNFVSSNAPIHIYSKKIGKDYCRFAISSKKLKNDLIRHGCTELKTTSLTFPDFLPNEFIKDFTRGYFDGDGSITYVTTQKQYKFRMCGTKEFLGSVKILFGIINPLTQRHPERDVNNYDIDFGGNIKVYKILNILYENSHVYLDRKFKRYCRLRSLHIEKYGC